MPSDYEAITKHNERQLGLDTASRRTQISMYSDSTHFIYEILQNADDYGATKIEFVLEKKRLVIRHNGLSFETENVEAITYFGKSTSKNDLVKTGRFGVGFKSVFAFTASPSIHSGEESFEIYELYRLRPAERPNGFRKTQTVIILPFNHEEESPDYIEEYMTANESYKKILNRLATLNMKTLLFTQNLKEIRWETSSKNGHYLREDKSRDDYRRTTITDGDTLNKYLIFSRIPTWHSQGYKPVEIAFGLDKKDKLTAIDDYLYVLFSTTQETHLKFILNGPYRTNPSRETIAEDDQFNVHLIKETATLFVEILPILRDMGLLTVQALAVFPNPTDKKLRHFYEPLRTVIIDCFKAEELVPTDSNSFARATEVFQGPAPIRDIIGSDDLSVLSRHASAVWAKGIQQNSRPDQFLRGLDIDQWGWGELESVLHNELGGYSFFSKDDFCKKWLSAKPDEWMQKFYLRLGDAIKKEDCCGWTLKQCRIVRVHENGMENHVAGAKSYFPKGRGYKELPQIKKTILKAKDTKSLKKIEESLIALGVSQIGDEERIDLLLETYYGGEDLDVTPQQNLSHMEVFIKWWKKEKTVGKFSDYSIFTSVGAKDLHKGSECYLDAPLRKSGLSVVYEDKKCSLGTKVKLWSGYKKVSVEGFCDFAVACGVLGRLSVSRKDCIHHPKNRVLRHDYNNYRVKFTSTGINFDYWIAGLRNLLAMEKREVNLLIWKTLAKANPKVLEAVFRPNQQYPIRCEKSSLVICLSKTAWIPNKRGTKMLPTEISKEQLHPSFKYDNRNGWLDEIGFGEEAKKTSEEYKKKKEMADTLGIPIEIAEFYKGLSPTDLKKEIAMVKKKKDAQKKLERLEKENISYHDGLENVFSAQGHRGADDSLMGGETRNTSRRRRKTKEEIDAAIENEGRSGANFSFGLRKKWKGKNDKVRTALADWYGGQCQVCGETFIQRSGEPYFEGLYLVPHTKADWLDREGNVLCLCPLHSAMFQYGEKKVEDDLIQTILDLKLSAEGGTEMPMLSMTLCGKDIQIKFKDNHLLDLQEIIKASEVPKVDESESES